MPPSNYSHRHPKKLKAMKAAHKAVKSGGSGSAGVGGDHHGGRVGQVAAAIVHRHQQTHDVRRERIHYPFRVMGGLGIAQIFLGILAMLMQVVGFYTEEPTSFMAAGIWGGMFFIATGSLAYVSTTKRHTRNRVNWTITVMVVSIFAILVALGMLAVASIGLHLTSNFKYDTEYPLSWKTLESLLVVIALVEALVAFLTSVMACKGIAINCRVPGQVGHGPESATVYMYMHRDNPDSSDRPPSIEMRPLVNTDGRTMAEAPPAPPPRTSYSVAPRPSSYHHHNGLILECDDFEPPPAYSEVQAS